MKYHENVLLVDDNELVLYSMRQYLERDFHYVAAVCTGEEALVQMRHLFFHIVVLDINLPGIDGWAVLEHIRQFAPRTSVIVATSCVDVDIRQRALKNGAFEHLEKPFEFDQLTDILNKILALFEKERKKLNPVEVRFESAHRGFTYNLSSTDIFILTAVPFERGATVNVTMHPIGREPIPLKGKVIATTNTRCGYLPSLSEGGEPGVKYGLTVKVLEHSPDFLSFLNALRTDSIGTA